MRDRVIDGQGREKSRKRPQRASGIAPNTTQGSSPHLEGAPEYAGLFMEDGGLGMSDPRNWLLSDDRAASIEEQTPRALATPEELSEVALEFALCTYTLLKDRASRVILEANQKQSAEPSR